MSDVFAPQESDDGDLVSWAPPPLSQGASPDEQIVRLVTWVSLLDREVAGLRRGRHRMGNAIMRVEGKLAGVERRLSHLEARLLGGMGAIYGVAELIRYVMQ